MSEEQRKNRPFRVIIADDHPVVRTGLRLMLQMRPIFELVGEAIDGNEAIRLVQELVPDVVLMDLRMPGVDGLSALKRIRQGWPEVVVLILTTYNEDDLIIQALQAGARGYLLKDTDLEVLLHAVERAAGGEMLIQPEMMQRILARAERGSTRQNEPGKQAVLTVREQDVLQGVARGERTKEIARRIGVSERTVWAHLTTIYNKLGVDSRAAAVAVAIERKLLPRGE